MSKTTQAADIDTFALNLMLDVWKIGNSHGPDSQRKAKIQCRLIDALKEFAAPIANMPAVPDGLRRALIAQVVDLAFTVIKQWPIRGILDKEMTRAAVRDELLRRFITPSSVSKVKALATPATNGREVPEEAVKYIRIGQAIIGLDGGNNKFVWQTHINAQDFAEAGAHGLYARAAEMATANDQTGGE